MIASSTALSGIALGLISRSSAVPDGVVTAGWMVVPPAVAVGLHSRLRRAAALSWAMLGVAVGVLATAVGNADAISQDFAGTDREAWFWWAGVGPLIIAAELLWVGVLLVAVEIGARAGRRRAP